MTDCISEINNTQEDNAKGIDVVRFIYSLTAYNDNYFKKSRILWQFYRDKPAFNDASVITDFTGDDSSSSFKFKQKITVQSDAGCTKDV